MSKLVTSATPLEKVEYFRRGDGLADIWLREDIKQVQHLGTDGTETTEYTAQETYLCRDLTEQEAVEQFDSLIQSAEIESMDDKERIAQLEQQVVDNATDIAALYEAQLTTASANDAGSKGASMNTLQQAMIAIYANLVRSGARTIDSIPKNLRDEVQKRLDPWSSDDAA